MLHTLTFNYNKLSPVVGWGPRPGGIGPRTFNKPTSDNYAYATENERAWLDRIRFLIWEWKNPEIRVYEQSRNLRPL